MFTSTATADKAIGDESNSPRPLSPGPAAVLPRWLQTGFGLIRPEDCSKIRFSPLHIKERHICYTANMLACATEQHCAQGGLD